MYVQVINNNMDRALRTLKKKLIEDGFFRTIQEGRFYEKPSDRRRRLKRAAIARRKRSENLR